MITLTIFDTAWYAISAFLVFSIGLFYAATQRTFNIPKIQTVTLYFWHSAMSAFYCYYSLSNSADSTGYFRRSYVLDREFAPGTAGIDYFTAIFTQLFGMSYFGVFMVFNLIGFFGLIIFATALKEVTANKSLLARQTAWLIPFFPGLNFWTGAIGKDALTFLASALVAWAILKFNRRYMAIFIAAGLYLFARPHMASILLIALVMSMLLLWKARIGIKLMLSLFLLPIMGFALFVGIQVVGLGEASSIDDFTQAVEYRQNVNLQGGSSLDIASMSIPVRMFTYLFRPLGFDASGILDIAASIENAFLLMLFIVGLYRFVFAKPTISYFPVLFFVLFAGAAWLLLGNTTANLGLALRQKWMFVPMLILLAYAYLEPVKAMRTRIPIRTTRKRSPSS